MDLGKLQTDQEWFGAIECILFVSGEPVDLVSLQRALGLTELELQSILGKMEESLCGPGPGRPALSYRGYGPVGVQPK